MKHSCRVGVFMDCRLPWFGRVECTEECFSLLPALPRLCCVLGGCPQHRRNSAGCQGPILFALLPSYDVAQTWLLPSLALRTWTCIFHCSLDLFGHPHTGLIQHVLNSPSFPESGSSFCIPNLFPSLAPHNTPCPPPDCSSQSS